MHKPTRFQVDQSLDHAERIMLVGVMLTPPSSHNHAQREQAFHHTLNEAIELIRATGGEWVCTETTKRNHPHSALFIGTGKAEELAKIVQVQNIELVIFNHELTPTQERNLEKILQCRVLDRVGLILAIFAQRARSQEGKLQVELAQLSHLSSRLIRGYGHLQSQTGGIGLKGPGETRLETDRRLIQNKINLLRRRLKEVKKQRATQRKARTSTHMKTFALIGYTNAGKSSLFNRLTKANVLAKDQLFATLDTTARKLYLNENTKIILADTVGFIRDLPHKLIAAFSATLEETALADVLIHVIDASNPHYEQQIQEVNAVLKEIKADNITQLFVYNKIDLLSNNEQNNNLQYHIDNKIDSISISVTQNWGIETLRHAIIKYAHMPS